MYGDDHRRNIAAVDPDGHWPSPLGGLGEKRMSFSKIAAPGQVRARRFGTAFRCLGILLVLHPGPGGAASPSPDAAEIRVAKALTIAQASPVRAGAATSGIPPSTPCRGCRPS